MLPIQKKLIAYNHSPGNDIQYIVIHDTANTGVGANAMAHYNYFNGGDRQASAHYFADDGNIVQLVEDFEGAWHVGDGGNAYGINNHNSIGIETCINSDGNYTAALSNTADLAAYLLTKYNLPMSRLVRHYDASRKNCPGRMNTSGNWSGWVAFQQAVASRLGQTAPAASTSYSTLSVGSSGSEVTVLQQALVKFDYNITVDGSFGPATKAAVVDFQGKNGLTADGIVGPMTWKAINDKIAELNAPKVLYRVILDNVQKMALSSQDDAIAAVKSVVDSGQATTGKVQRNTDGVDVFTYSKPVPQPTVMYRVIIDGKQIEALSSQDAAVARVKSLVDSGQGTSGKVQRNTDSVDVFTYTKPVIVTPPPVVTPPIVTPPAPAPVIIEKHSLMGQPEVTAEQMAQFLIKHNASPAIDVPALDFAKIYLEEGAIEGIRGDIAFCQSIHETGYFRFGGQVLPEQHNYAGIGATNNSAVGKGAWFTSAREGIRAQIQHLKAYASAQPLVQPCIDPRYSLVTKGVAPTLEDLAGRWAVPGYPSNFASLDDALKAGQTYGQLIYALVLQIKQEVVIVKPDIPQVPYPYHVNRKFNDMLDELGTYNNIEDAKILADQNPGYVVFDNQGNIVYGTSIQGMAIVTVNSLNVRSIPLMGDNTIIGVLRYNQTVEVRSIKDGWAAISFNKTIAYVKADFIRLL